MSTTQMGMMGAPTLTPEGQQEYIIRALLADRPLAHEHFFAHRHKNVTPDFHREILSLFYSSAMLVALQAFRGAAKSTSVEEYVIMTALYREASFILIIGNTWTNAVQRLAAIKHELENNELIEAVFGSQIGPTWSQDNIVLTNGVKIQAVGARQSLRGFKHNEARPDLAVIDDFEDDEGVATEEAREKNSAWLHNVLLPALDVACRRVRMLGTPLHPKALMETVMFNPEWVSRRYPVTYLDENGAETATWEDRFPLATVAKIRNEYTAQGRNNSFMQEYMCVCEDQDAKPFQQSMIKIEAKPRTWQPVEIMVDPARTVGAKSARTGYAVWTWEGHRLHVLEAFGGFHLPDQMADTIFKLDEKYTPAAIGVEADGLEEFLMQPLRAEMVKRSTLLPLQKQRAPRDKLGFITGLRPFFMAGDITLSPNCTDLITELLSFPTGRMDVPNALAYALKMRPGAAVYEDFGGQHIRPEVIPLVRTSFYLVVSSRQALTAATLLQFKDGRLLILKDWMQYGPPQEQFPVILREAALYGTDIKVLAPEEQHDKYLNSGLPAVVKAAGLTLLKGQSVIKAEGALAPWLQKQVKGAPAVEVDERCRWVINGLARGYCRSLQAGGTMAPPEDNQYKVLIEAIESFAGTLERLNNAGDINEAVRYAYTPDGRRFMTTLPARY